jgi:hypothetical protein
MVTFKLIYITKNLRALHPSCSVYNKVAQLLWCWMSAEATPPWAVRVVTSDISIAALSFSVDYLHFAVSHTQSLLKPILPQIASSMATVLAESHEETDRTTYEEARKGAAAYLQSRLTQQDDLADKGFSIPVIDLAPSFADSLADRQAVADQIRKACTTSGFFYISNHGVASSTRDGILKQAERFYDLLSIKQKEDLHIKNSKLGLGWEPGEYTSIAGDQEKKEGYNFAYEAALDRSGGDGLYRNLDGTQYKANLWPKEEDLPGFYDEVKKYYGAVSAARRGFVWLC